ncbi:MAG TPA: hypothetical protein VKU82_10845 [Planctomycetaceae bacterium]|nr:hypothetical protein [Planctomycetaceae bacterium]
MCVQLARKQRRPRLNGDAVNVRFYVGQRDGSSRSSERKQSRANHGQDVEYRSPALIA